MKTLMIATLAATLTAATIAVPAFAQDGKRAFDGPYVGAQIGINRDQVGARINPTTQLDKAVSRNSFATGLYAGWNFPIGKSVVAGPEVGIGININDSLTGRQNGLASSIDPRQTFDIGARVGVRATDNTLIYARGGYSNVRVDRRDAQADGTTIRRGQTYQGFSLGGGVEHRISQNVSARVEYRFANLDENGGKWRRHQVLAGISYNF